MAFIVKRPVTPIKSDGTQFVRINSNKMLRQTFRYGHSHAGS